MSTKKGMTAFEILNRKLTIVDSKVTALLDELDVDLEGYTEPEDIGRRAPVRKMRLQWQGQDGLNKELIRHYNEGRRTDWIADQFGCDRNRVQSAITRLRNQGLLPRRNGSGARAGG